MCRDWADSVLRLPTLVRLLLALLSIVFLGGCRPEKREAPRAERGQIDLRNQNLTSGAIALRGDYEFFWKRFVDPGAPQPAPSADGYLRVPGDWSGFVPQPGSGLVAGGPGPAVGAVRSFGFASYRLRVQLPEQSARLGLSVPTMHTAYRLFANGQVIAANGRPGSSRTGSVPAYRPMVVALPDSNNLDLVLHVSNYHHRRGGTWSDIKIGSVDLLRADREGALFLQAFLIGSLLIMGAYHVGLFLMRRSLRSALYFGLFCGLIAIRTGTTGQHWLSVALPNLSWEFYIKFQYLSFFLAVPAFGGFVHHVFPQELPRALLKALFAVSATAALAALILPARYSSLLIVPFELFTILCGVILLIVLALCLARRREGALLYSLGWVVFFGTVINDILLNDGFISSYQLVSFGFVVFVAVQSIMLTRRFSRALGTAERLSHEMEARIEERTRELKVAGDELRAARDRAEAMARTKAEFLARMSHEIRTPLNSILGAASILSETLLRTEYSEHVSVLSRAGRRLLTLINEILDLSKMEAGKLTLEPRPFEVRRLTENLYDIMHGRAVARGISLICSCEPDVPHRVIGDPERIEQILLNLVGNGIKFTESGTVSLWIERCGGSDSSVDLRFHVADTGIGIARDQHAKIFESFVQADQQDSRRFGGTGLGLAISRDLVTLMGGQLQLESTPGVGSHFWFDLTLVRSLDRVADGGSSPDSPGASAPAVTDFSNTLADCRVLLAEDNPDNVFLIRAFLKGSGVNLEVVGGGGEALDLATARTYDMILMDIQMPGMDGYEATRAIRKAEQERNVGRTPIIALTADATNDALHKSLLAGCDAYLTKPIDRQSLLAAMAAHMAQGSPASE